VQPRARLAGKLAELGNFVERQEHGETRRGERPPSRFFPNKRINSALPDAPPKRGAPKGNTNALKHGRKSAAMQAFRAQARFLITRLKMSTKLVWVALAEEQIARKSGDAAAIAAAASLMLLCAQTVQAANRMPGPRPVEAQRPVSALHIDSGDIAIAAPDADGVRAYKGLPYAAPPTGTLRWREPQPVVPWNGVRATDRFGPNCLQPKMFNDIDPFTPAMSEDCLYLNVWTAAKPGERLPVFFWIHGGGYQAGSGSELRHDGTALAKKGVIVVTINYRLGVFGFLAHPELTAESAHHTSGDYAFLDMIAALKWVQRNIATFGGDPSRVAIAGESAGSDAVARLMASPLAKGLFKRAIAESGSPFGEWGGKPLADAEANGVAFARAMSGDDIAQLRARSSAEILALETAPNTDWKFVADVDGWFLPKPVPAIFAAGEQNDVPLIVGWNRDEGVFFTAAAENQKLADYFVEKFGDLSADAARLYAAGSPEEEKRARIDLGTDVNMGLPIWRWAMAQRATGHSPVYLYRFDHTPPVPPDWFGKAMEGQFVGAFHSGDIPYVFGHPDVMPRWRIAAADRALADEMSSRVAAFVATGSPNSTSLADWPAYDANAPQRMIFDDPSHVAPDADVARRQFLNEAIPLAQ
jgi:para-nitrobenzyl esterase